jgi:hypothetical protein
MFHCTLSIVARTEHRRSHRRLAPGAAAFALCAALGTLPWPARAESPFAGVLDKLRASDIDFQRGASNAPFIPVASLSARHYGRGRLVDGGDNTVLEFEQDTVSASALLPLHIGQRDAFFTGAWASRSRFHADADADASADDLDDFHVDSVGAPIGWLKQVDDRWQAAAFVMPLAHRSTQDGSNWTLQTLGGAFARYLHSDTLWWAVGVFADSGPDESYIIPYAGASWIINPRWTLSAIMPWPAVLYAPDRNWLLRLGAAPSGASWTVRPGDADIAVNLDTWNFGLAVERHLTGGLWLGLESGVGGLRGLRLNVDEGEFDAGDFSIGSSGYLALSLRLRAR